MLSPCSSIKQRSDPSTGSSIYGDFAGKSYADVNMFLEAYIILSSCFITMTTLSHTAFIGLVTGLEEAKNKSGTTTTFSVGSLKILSS